MQIVSISEFLREEFSAIAEGEKYSARDVGVDCELPRRTASRIIAYSFRGRFGWTRLRWRFFQMKISARNVIPGIVASVAKGAVNAEILLTLRGGETVVAVITNESVDSLELQEGQSVFAIIKASDVMIGKNLKNAKLSARNILAGKVAELREGAVNSEVAIRLPGGTILIASITRVSVNALKLTPGDEVSAVVKASHVMVGA
jgi:molybdate transport system regulatory protein